MNTKSGLRWRSCLMAIVGTACLAGGLAAAQEIDDGSKARVNLASKLGMLSQEIAAAACRVNGNIEPDKAKAVLGEARVEVSTILDGLENGNRILGVPTPETQRRTLRALRIVGDDWNRINGAIGSVLDGKDLAANATRIAEATPAFNENSDKLASEIQARYSNPNEMLVVDALAIQMAGRQRSLIEKAAAQSCLLATGAGDVEALKGATSLFEKTLVALRDGYPAAGIRQPPNDQVKGKIEAAWGTWQSSRPALDAAATGQVDHAAVVQITANSDRLRKDMNDLVILYILSTPGRDGAIRSLLKEIADKELVAWTQDPALVAAVVAQNASHPGITEEQIIVLDKQWRAEEKAKGGPLIDELMARPVSVTLHEKQVATAGFINEIFVMDNVGLNVAQSAVTSDYWQGDEDKWQKSYGDGTGAGNVHISDVEFDDSTGVFQSQVSLPVKDGAGNLIGAMTFGVNVQSLM